MTAFRICPSPRCAELNPVDAFYCSTCGYALVENATEQTWPRCPWCGKQITHGAKACREHRGIPDPYEAVA